MTVHRMTDEEVLEHMRGDTPLDRARRAFSGACGRIDNARRQRCAPPPIEMRRMEFEAVAEIAEAIREVPELAPPVTAEACAAFLDEAAAAADPESGAKLAEAARLIRMAQAQATGPSHG